MANPFYVNPGTGYGKQLSGLAGMMGKAKETADLKAKETAEPNGQTAPQNSMPQEDIKPTGKKDIWRELALIIMNQ